MLQEHAQFPDVVLIDKDGVQRRFSDLAGGRACLVVLAPGGTEHFISRLSARLREIRAFGAKPLVIEVGDALNLDEPPLFPVVRLADRWEAAKDLGLEGRMGQMLAVAVVDRDGDVQKVYRQRPDRPPSVSTLIGWLGFLDRHA